MTFVMSGHCRDVMVVWSWHPCHNGHIQSLLWESGYWRYTQPLQHLGDFVIASSFVFKLGRDGRVSHTWSPDHLVRSWTETELSAGLLLSLSRQIFAFNHLFNLRGRGRLKRLGRGPEVFVSKNLKQKWGLGLFRPNRGDIILKLLKGPKKKSNGGEKY